MAQNSWGNGIMGVRDSHLDSRWLVLEIIGERYSSYDVIPK